MRFLPPFALFSAHDSATDGRGDAHIAAYLRLLSALRDDTLDLEAVLSRELLDDGEIPLIDAIRGPAPSDTRPSPSSITARISE